jgi:hypothetical protein
MGLMFMSLLLVMSTFVVNMNFFWPLLLCFVGFFRFGGWFVDYIFPKSLHLKAFFEEIYCKRKGDRLNYNFGKSYLQG